MTNYVRKNKTSKVSFTEDLTHFTSQNLELAASLDSDTPRKEKFLAFEHLKNCSECTEVFYHLNLQKALSLELNQDKELPNAVESRLWKVLRKEQK